MATRAAVFALESDSYGETGAIPATACHHLRIMMAAGGRLGITTSKPCRSRHQHAVRVPKPAAKL